MLQLNLTVKQSGPTLKGVAKQIPFAAALTINRTLEEGQQAFRAKLPSEFKLRRPTFIQRLVKIENRDRATKTHLVGRMGIQGTRADLLTKFELGGDKTPAPGHHDLTLPANVKRTKADIIRGDQRAGRLLSSPSSGAYKLTTKQGKTLILRRTGRGKNKVSTVLYVFSKRVHLKPQLHFIRTVDPVLRARLPINFHGFLVTAIRSAKP
jgi:hypothetical protein